MMNERENNLDDLYEYIESTNFHKSPNRYKIDKLLNTPDIRYRGPLTYRTIRMFGFLLMLFAQIYIAYNFVNKLVDVPKTAMSIINALNIVSTCALPMFLAANFCVIMSSRNRIKKYFINYSVIAISIYIGVMFVYYRYLYGAMFAIVKDSAQATAMAESIAQNLFGGLMNYNVFIDLSLFSMFFFFLFYTPKKELSHKKLMLFRWCSIIPVIFAIVAFVLYALNYMSIIHLPMAILALLPCRSLTVYIIMFTISLVMKLRRYKFLQYGGTVDEYNRYLETNRNSLEVSIISSIIVLILCILDFVLIVIDVRLFLFGFGASWYLIVIIPFIFLLSYSRKPKYPVLDYALPATFVSSCVIVYLEAVLFVIKGLFKM